jgi:hypothetical protein
VRRPQGPEARLAGFYFFIRCGAGVGIIFAISGHMNEFEQDDESRICDFIKEASLSLDERALAAFVRGMLARQKAVTGTSNEDSAHHFVPGGLQDWPDASPLA